MRNTSAEDAQRQNIEGEVEDEGVIISAGPDVWVNQESRIQVPKYPKEKTKTEGEAEDRVFKNCFADR